MATLFIAVTVLAMGHFVYEGILAPSFRCYLRFKLFAERDKLRALKIGNRQEFDTEAFKEMEDSVNSAISLLSRMDVISMIRFQLAFRRDEELRTRIMESEAITERCQIPDAHKITAKTTEYFYAAVGVNNAFLFLFLLPIVLIVNAIKDIPAFLKKILLLPLHDAHSIMDDGLSNMREPTA